MSIAKKIEELMKEQNITKYRLSKDSGVPYTTLTQILSERTKHPQIDSLKQIADYFNKSVDYFTDGVNEYLLNPQIPEWASAKDKRDFKKMLEEDGEIMFDGVPIEGEARQRVLDVLTGLFWEAKQMNKKTYGRKNKKDTQNNNNE